MEYHLKLTARHWKMGLGLILLAGLALRLIWVGDMEYKEDEDYMFRRLMSVGVSEPWPWLGIASGVHVRNPALSVWVFVGLGKILGVTEPTGLCRIVQCLNIAALALLVLTALRLVAAREREPWLWAAALAAVNPFAVMYHRKIWAQSVLPFFCVLFLMAWLRRDRRGGAFAWGLVGAALGQIHMSGFFFAFALAAWTFFADRARPRWRPWLAGSFLGALPLIPWVVHLATFSSGNAIFRGWEEAAQLKFWVFWLTDPIGLHLGNPLGVHHGNSMLQQLGDFVRYPLLGGQPTYGLGAAHVAIAGIAAALWIRALLALFFRADRMPWRDWLRGGGSETGLLLRAAGIGYGALLTLATLKIYRFYLIVTFPLEFVWLAGAGLSKPASGRVLLAALVVLELVVSIGFLGYVHVNEGALGGDYGGAYHTTPKPR